MSPSTGYGWADPPSSSRPKRLCTQNVRYVNGSDNESEKNVSEVQRSDSCEQSDPEFNQSSDTEVCDVGSDRPLLEHTKRSSTSKRTTFKAKQSNAELPQAKPLKAWPSKTKPSRAKVSNTKVSNAKRRAGDYIGEENNRGPKRRMAEDNLMATPEAEGNYPDPCSNVGNFAQLIAPATPDSSSEDRSALKPADLSSDTQGEEQSELEELGSDEEEEEEDSESLFGRSARLTGRARKVGANPDPFKYKIGFQQSLPPMASIQEFFHDMTGRALGMPIGLEEVSGRWGGRPLRVATMCSGTESPIMALSLVCKNAVNSFGFNLRFEHVFSAEIVPFKQSFVERNYNPATFFQDICEMSRGLNDDQKATTVFGAQAVIPGNIDILIAGTCCVDFSNLNREQKDVFAGGESGDTFLAMRHYCSRKRPTLVLLENVHSAPWGVLDKLMQDVGYSCRYIKLDSKQFYIPQTRTRGYMLAVDNERLGRENIMALLDTWENNVKFLKRPASVPFDNLLLPADDPRVFHASQFPIARNVKDKGGMKWETCAMRHETLRAQLGLGLGRPLTKWVNGGSSTLPDYCGPALAKRSTRELDMIDISLLRGIIRGYCLTHKSRVMDHSQNVDFNRDNSGSGIAQCFTPSGFPVLTRRYAPVCPEEVMIGQGLDIDGLDFSRLSPMDIKDLAGNAMTSTVVGACLIGALGAFGRILSPSGNPPSGAAKVHRDHKLDREDILVKGSHNPSQYVPITTAEAMRQAGLSARLCRCEGKYGLVRATLQRCTCCRHTTCIKCGKNPLHHYEPIPRDATHLRIQPFNFTKMIQGAIPMKLPPFLEGPEASTGLLKLRQGTIIYSQLNLPIDCLTLATSSQLCFRSIKRANNWTIEYESDYAKAILELGDKVVQWLIYAKVPTWIPGNSPVRNILQKNPFARMQPADDSLDIMQGNWEVWNHDVQTLPVTVTGQGDLVPSYRNHMGLVAHNDTFISPSYSIQMSDRDASILGHDIRGVYELSERCGMAFNSLHIQSSTRAYKNPMFLYLDSDWIGHPDQDCFVFSSDIKRLEPDQHRVCIAKLENSWRQPEFKRVVTLDKSEGHKYYPISKCDDPTEPVEVLILNRVQTVKLIVDGKWMAVEDFGFNFAGEQRSIVHHQLPKMLIPVSRTNSCHISQAFFSCETILPNSVKPWWPTDKWSKLEPAIRREFFADLTWCLQKSLQMKGYSELDAEWQTFSTSASATACPTCAPQAPAILWKLEGNTQIPFENPAEAGKYERAMKARPCGLSASFFIGRGSNLFKFKIGVNYQTLCHAATSRLLTNGCDKDISNSWRFITDDVNGPKAKLTRLRLQSNDGDELVPTLKPQLFAENYNLRTEQEISLSWVLARERNPQVFTEMEIVEDQIPELSLRAEAMATANVTNAGGILAEQPGFGKTAVVLGLVASQYDQDRKLRPRSGAISIEATVIFVPFQLPDQWAKEVTKFLPKMAARILVIKSIQTLVKLTIEDFQNADIIIVNIRLVEGEAYMAKVAEFAGMIEPEEKSSSRAISTWYNKARSNISEHVQILQCDSSSLKEKISDSYRANILQATKAELPIPSKRIQGAAYQAAKIKVQGDGKEPKKITLAPIKARGDTFQLGELAKGVDWRRMKSPLFEMFHYPRVVVDEFSYAGNMATTVIRSLRTVARWGLSGTPDMRNFADIKRMANLIGINLGIDDLPSMIPSQVKSVAKDYTRAELCRTYSAAPSKAWIQRRHSHAQGFLNLFARQNVADIEAIQHSVHLCVIRHSAPERAMLLELIQRLDAAQWSPKLLRGAKRGDMIKIAGEAASASNDPMVALLVSTSHFSAEPEDSSVEAENAPSQLHLIYKRRQEEYLMHQGKIAKELKKAEWLFQNVEIKDNTFPACKDRLCKNNYGDIEATAELQQLVIDAQNSYSFDDWTKYYLKSDIPKNSDMKAYPEGMSTNFANKHLFMKQDHLRHSSGRLGSLASELVNLRRLMRLIESFLYLQSDTTLPTCGVKIVQGLTCSACGLKGLFPSDILLHVSCGHIICKKFCKLNDQDETCPVEGCTAVSKPFQRVPGSEICSLDAGLASGPASGHNSGKKLEEICNLIQHTPEADRVLLFIQFPSLTNKVKQALTMRGITFADLSKERSAAQVLVEFQEEDDSKVKKRGTRRKNTKPALKTKVLLLELGKASASGSNLTIANHVIFLAPYHVSGVGSQQLYDAAMTQAIGRAVRYGQKKHVYIYQFVTALSPEVDILEMRSRKLLKLSTSSPNMVPPYKDLEFAELVEPECGEERKLGSSIAHLLINEEDKDIESDQDE